MENPNPNPEVAHAPRLPFYPLLVHCSSSSMLLNIMQSQPEVDIPESQLMIHFPRNTSYHLFDLDTDHKTPYIGAPVEVKTSPSFYGFEVTHSCNGLLLLERIRDDFHRAIVCNPVTGEYIFLPESTHVSKNVTCAFFVSPSTRQFKVLRAFHRVPPPEPVFDSDHASSMDLDLSSDCSTELDPFSDLDLHSNTSLSSKSNSESNSDSNFNSNSDSDSESSTDSDDYSVDSDIDRMGELLVSGTDSWESVIDPGELPFSPSNIYSPCYLNNSPNWLFANYYVPNFIVFFNFETNEFGVFYVPTPITKDHMFAKDDMSLFVLDGCLSIFDGFTEKGEFHIWVMKEYGVRESWSKDFVINTSAWGVYGIQSYKPKIVRANGEVVMICENGCVVLYDLLKKSGRFMRYKPVELPFEVLAYTPSVTLLRDFVVGGNMLVLNLASRFSKLDRNIMELLGTFFE